jgi:hypothetical protein
MFQRHLLRRPPLLIRKSCQQTLSEKPNPAGLQFVKTYDYDGVRKYEVEQVDTTGKLVFGSLCNGG